MSIKALFWGAYAVFVALALSLGWHGEILAFSGPLAFVKLLVWVAFIGFLAYSIYCSAREDLFQSVAKLAELTGAGRSERTSISACCSRC